MFSRRRFLGSTGAFACTPAALHINWSSELEKTLRRDGSPEEIATDEDYWYEIGRQFTVDRNIVNLNNGGVSPSPLWVQDSMKKHLDFSNQAVSYHMWRILEPMREGVRQRLAREFGADSEEIALTRNASESLMICQFGIDLQKGDTVICTNQDYPRMVNTFKQRARREQIGFEQFSIREAHGEEQAIVKIFEENIRRWNAKVVLISHMINLTGQILPVKRVVAMARKYGVQVIVDGAHSLAHFDFKISDLECDYFATSLHKWLFAPHGTGLLYVRREKIAELWPLMAAAESQKEDIRKFEEIGTHPAANYLAIAEALTFHQGIGARRKEARLIYLRNYWAKFLLSLSRVKLHTSLETGHACGIACVEIDGVAPKDLYNHLWKNHKILTTPINHKEFRGLRISPSVYTTLEELDRFKDAMAKVAEHGLPS